MKPISRCLVSDRIVRKRGESHEKRQAACCGCARIGIGALIGYSALAGGDKVAFPENFDKDTLYATVSRYDNKQYRELYATPAAVDAVRKGQPIPSGTVLTLVQYKAQLDAAGSRSRTPAAVSRRATSSPTR